MDKKITLIGTSEYLKNFQKRINGLHNYIFKSNQDLINDMLGSYDFIAYIDFAIKRGTSYEIAKIYLNNSLLVDEDSSDSLLHELYLIKNEYKSYYHKDIFKKNLYRNVLLHHEIDNHYVAKALQNCHFEIKKDERKPNIVVHQFDSTVSEVVAVANEIVRLLDKGVSPNSIKINALNDYYYPVLKDVFSFYQIDIMENSTPLIALREIKRLYNKLDLFLDMDAYDGFTKAMENENSFEAKLFLNVLNQFIGLNYKIGELKPFIYEILCQKTFSDNYDNVIKFYDLADLVINDGDYLFVLGFNQDVLPKNHKDNGLIDNKLMKILDLPSTLDLNKAEKKNLMHILNDAYYVSFSLLCLNGSLMPSPFISELGLNVLEEEPLSLNKERLKYHLADLLDDYYDYGTINDDMLGLASYLGCSKDGFLDKGEYQSYDYHYNGSFHQDKGIVVSYTSLDKYNSCPFKYYLEDILKLEKPSDELNLIIGNYFHYCLEKDEDIDCLTNEFFKDINLDSKMLYYINRMKKYILSIREFNKFESDFELFGKEVKVRRMVDDSLLVGKIDKLLTYKDYACVLDYKTGNVAADLKPVYYGLKMQLPMYMYFLHDEYQFGGIYYQMVLPKNPFDDSKDEEASMNQFMRWQGFSNLDVVCNLDHGLSHIKGIKIKKDGNFDSNSFKNSLDDKKMLLLMNKMDEKIKESIKNIKAGLFSISPKEYEKKTPCNFCDFKDVCFFKKYDVVKLEKIDWLGDSDDSQEA